MRPRIFQVLKLIVLGGALLAPIGLEAAEQINQETPSVKSEVDKAFITIGEKINYQISVRHTSLIQVKDIDVSDTLRFFEVKEWKNFSEKNESDLIEGKKFILTSFELGEFVLPPAKITYTDNAGAKHQIQSNTLYVTVESVDKGTKAKDDILGDKGVVSIKNFLHSRYFWIAFLLLLCALGIAWATYSKKKNAGNLEPKENLLPHEEAYRALARLSDSDLIQNGFYPAYYAGLSEILRRYFEHRYHFFALESTTEEVIQKIKELNLDGKTKTLIRNLLEMCDLAKFAKYRPTPAEITLSTQQAREIIDLTKEIVISEPEAS